MRQLPIDPIHQPNADHYGMHHQLDLFGRDGLRGRDGKWSPVDDGRCAGRWRSKLGAPPDGDPVGGRRGCAAYDVVLILERGRQAVTGCQVKLTAERADADPKVFVRIHMHFIVSGRDLPEAAVERAVQLSHDKYCSATQMLGKTAEITKSFEVLTG